MGLVAQNDKAAAPGLYLFGDDVTRKSISLTADGSGPIRGGTGFNATHNPDAPAASYSALCVNDTQVAFAQEGGLYPNTDVDPLYELGGDGSTFQSWKTVWSKRYATRVGVPLASAATISPDSGIHHVTGTTQVQTVAPPFPGFTGQVTLILDENCDFATGGNIDPYAIERASLAAVSAASAGGKAKIELTYDGSTWF